MSSDAYKKVHDAMSDEQIKAMWALWQSGVNHDGHAWVTFGDVEECVAKLLQSNEKCGNCKRWKHDVSGCTDFVGRCEYANWMIGETGHCTYWEAQNAE